MASRPPYPRLRWVLWGILAFTWPVVQVVRIIWAPRWGNILSDSGAGLVMSIGVGGKLLILSRHAAVARRLDQWDRAWSLLAPYHGLRLVRGGASRGLAGGAAVPQQVDDEGFPGGRGDRLQ